MLLIGEEFLLTKLELLETVLELLEMVLCPTAINKTLYFKNKNF